jgi:two-component system cell cycle response regulator
LITKSATPRKMKILMVDPAANLLCRFEHIFAINEVANLDSPRFNFQFFSVQDKSKVLEIYKAEHPDLVMIDMEIGESESKDLCQAIRKSEGKRHTGIILLAAKRHLAQATPIECLEMGADDVIRPNCSMREIRARAHAVLRLKAMTDELRSANHKLQKLSNTDELTGLHNMRSFTGKYSKAIKDCRAGNNALGVIMMDLDNFKLVNDRTNHLVGSHVISEVGKLMASCAELSSKDCVARYGGDEYIIFTRDNDLQSVVKKAEAIRNLIENAVFIKDGQSVRVTASLGISWTPPGFKREKIEDPIKAADMMLYKSKSDGRNLVSCIVLRDSIDLDHIGRTHVVDGDASGHDDNLARIHNS